MAECNRAGESVVTGDDRDEIGLAMDTLMATVKYDNYRHVTQLEINSLLTARGRRAHGLGRH